MGSHGEVLGAVLGFPPLYQKHEPTKGVIGITSVLSIYLRSYGDVIRISIGFEALRKNPRRSPSPPGPPLFNVEVSRFPLGAAERSHNTCFRKLVPNIESGGRGESYSGGKDKRRRSRS